MKRVLVALCVSLLVASCTKSGDIYDSSKHTKEDFSAGNTALGVLGAGLIVACIAMAEDCADGLGSGGSTTDTDWDWDYLPGSGEWRCRGIQTGQFAPDENCAYDAMDDDRWPT